MNYRVGNVNGWNILFYTTGGADDPLLGHTGGPGYCAPCRGGGGTLGRAPFRVPPSDRIYRQPGTGENTLYRSNR
jgi:hypothetical protein